MDAATRDALDALNRDFYETHAGSFSSTRDHAWPGWTRIAERLPVGRCRLLDAGCGNGRFARFLADTGHETVAYHGVDSSAALVARALEALRDWKTCAVRIERADLFEAPPAHAAYDAIVLFGVLHHVPGFDRRVELLARLAAGLAPNGFLAATLWRFGADARAAGHSVPFTAHPVGVDPARVEAGDHLLRWRAGDPEAGGHEAVRYCHFVDDAEVERLLGRTGALGLRLADRFRSDGRSADLNEYLVWTRDAR